MGGIWARGFGGAQYWRGDGGFGKSKIPHREVLLFYPPDPAAPPDLSGESLDSPLPRVTSHPGSSPLDTRLWCSWLLSLLEFDPELGKWLALGVSIPLLGLSRPVWAAGFEGVRENHSSAVCRAVLPQEGIVGSMPTSENAAMPPSDWPSRHRPPTSSALALTRQPAPHISREDRR